MPPAPVPRKKRYESESRSQQREQTKARLLDAAEARFSEAGYENVSVADIAGAAKVVPSLINTYFAGKAGLLMAVVARHNAPQWPVLMAILREDAPALDRLDRFIAAQAAMDLGKPRLLAGLQGLSWTWPPESEAANIEELRPARDALAALVRDGIAEGTIRPIPEEIAVETIIAVYTQGLRPVVFGTAEVATAATLIQQRLRALLAA
ncbi:TetR/AcrR family transcriptional regulator [Roseomonas stagni]|uniref:TetR/AcrR family transcriptional regulator n=1 Tax=Falsiroseomonas algicola TaxID=2716930 RepID=A0A6M1LM16_9PROT|nr:TetR/AcrR family transcriptional regulator [Falsiroseomonas algicola]NGM21391.1 TetR/AcrR family transcriptional regulator [Falsiroseomonas algicola]